MKVILLSVGKTDNDFFSRIIDDYTKRINFYIPFEIVFVPDLKNRRGLSINEMKDKEGKSLLSFLQATDYIVLLDDKGKQFDSSGFARYLEKKMNSVPKRLVFIVGGPYGFSRELYNRASETLSLSTMTFTHQMVRMVFTEQLYRALTILNNEPYHHE